MPFDTSLRNSSESQAKLGPYQEGVKSALKKAGEAHAAEAIASRVPPQVIEQQSGLSQAMAGQSTTQSAPDTQAVLQQLMSLAGTKINDPGTIRGPFMALADLVKGNGFHPLASQQTPIGFDNAEKVMTLQNNMGAEQRRQSRDTRIAPGEEAKTISLLLKAATDQAKMTGDYSLLNMLTPQNPQGANGQPSQQDAGIDPAFRQEMGQENVKRIGDARTELDKYTRTITPLMSDIMKFQDIAEQLPSYKGGIVNQIIAKGDTVAKAMSADPIVTRMNSVLDRSLGGLVKYGGDSGNLAEQEQQRAKKAIGATNLPLSEKIQIYNDTLERVFEGLNVRQEQAQDKNYDKRFPLIAKARERYASNSKILSGQAEDFKTRLNKIGQQTGAKITYEE